MNLLYNERLKYYLGSFYNKQNVTINIDSKYKTFRQDGIYYYLGPNNYPDNFKFTHGCVKPGWWWGNNNQFIVDFPCLTNSADGYESDGLPVLTKARIIGKENNGILLKYEYNYHWRILETLRDPYKWDEKENNIIWRGSSNTSHQKKYNRHLFVNKYYTKYNIGFYDVTRNPTIPIEQNKNNLTIKAQLKYKYLICLEGNDVATSLKWALFSNSVVLMAKPVIEGWLMEGLLEPYFHYVPLKDDFSDLDKIIEWCKNNDDKCQEISINSTKYMSQFLDYNNELKLHNAIVDWYKQNIILV